MICWQLNESFAVLEVLMINSHYIPRLILKKFSDDKEHLIYADLIP